MTVNFLQDAATGLPVFYRTYSRWLNAENRRENWEEVTQRCVKGFATTGNLSDADLELLTRLQLEGKVMPSGRWLWVGGSEWVKHPQNFYGAYNCNSTAIDSLESFAQVMDLLMQGCGVGAVLERKHTEKLPKIKNYLNVEILDLPVKAKEHRSDLTAIDFYSKKDSIADCRVLLILGDSRQGWTEALYQLLCLTALDFGEGVTATYEVQIDLSNIRPDGERINGFGGTTNSVGLKEFFKSIVKITNTAIGRQLTPIECALIINTTALVVVAGNVRRSAIIEQFDADNIEAQLIKKGLWKEVDGVWTVDPNLDCMRMANLTRVFHTKPNLEQCIESVTEQYYSGEGAIQWAGEAVARANLDLLNTDVRKANFLEDYCENLDYARSYLATILSEVSDLSEVELGDRMNRYGLNPCGEIIQHNNFCNLSEVHLNRLDPLDLVGQLEAFKAAGLSVATLLHQQFTIPKYRQSRELDPIVGVSFTGLFDFFVHAFGSEWLRWWSVDRNPEFKISVAGWEKLNKLIDLLDIHTIANCYHLQNFDGAIYSQIEKIYLTKWKNEAEKTVRKYCATNNLKCPNRFTTVQPAGTKSLLTGASPGWHPPIAQRYIRRITFRKDDPVALACIDQGYTVVPSQNDKDVSGNLLNDPFDPLCTEWLVEIPTEVSWASLPDVDLYDLNRFSAHAQFDFYMTVQIYYTQHNTSATILFRESEIESLATAISQAIDTNSGYISAALLARFDANETFPRLPFEPINKAKFDDLMAGVKLRQTPIMPFADALAIYDRPSAMVDAGCAPCDSGKCDLGASPIS
jgi:ribonucleotide reductase class II